MKHSIILFCLCFLLGCTSTQQSLDSSRPRILYQNPLPEFPQSDGKPPMTLDLSIHVGEDGSVLEAKLDQSSGNESWDAKALAIMRQWKFAPARRGDQPFASWLHMQATVKYENPMFVNLAEILCSTLEIADSVYKALQAGGDFGELALKFSVDPSRDSKGFLGELNINSFPENIKKAIGGMAIEQYSQPMQYGDNYVIFKRIAK